VIDTDQDLHAHATDCRAASFSAAAQKKAAIMSTFSWGMHRHGTSDNRHIGASCRKQAVQNARNEATAESPPQPEGAAANCPATHDTPTRKEQHTKNK
jgi:hypothetical protein